MTSPLIPNPSRAVIDQTTAQLITIWEDILKQTGIGPQDDFFDLGGHSLLAVQMMQQIKKRLGRSLPVAILYDASTPMQLAEMLNAPDRAAISASHVPVVLALRESGKRPPLFCVPVASPGSLLSGCNCATSIDGVGAR